MTSLPESAGICRRAFLCSAGVVALAAEFPATRAAEPAKKAEDADRWKSLFDGKALGAWKSSDFSRPGKVYVKDGDIVIEKGSPMTGITYGRDDFPKTDYEVALEGKKLDGDDFFCTTTFPVGKSFCSLVVGGWGGTTVGLSSINSADASENETSTSKEFRPNVWYRVRIRVTAGRIQAWIDDDKLVDADIENKKISTRIECNPSKPFGVATYYTSGAVRNVRVRPLTAAEIKAAAEKKAAGKE
jgi:Domain of Unknown Function (DUF1080)